MKETFSRVRNNLYSLCVRKFNEQNISIARYVYQKWQQLLQLLVTPLIRSHEKENFNSLAVVYVVKNGFVISECKNYKIQCHVKYFLYTYELGIPYLILYQQTSKFLSYNFVQISCCKERRRRYTIAR